MCAFQIVPPLLSLLHEARERFGYVPVSAIEEIARRIDMPVASVLGICDGYDAFRDHTPTLRIGVPDCPANMIRGALGMFEQFTQGLGDLHHTVDSRKVIVEWASCHGHCFEAPYIVVNNHVYTHVTHGTIEQIIQKIRKGTYRVPREQPLMLPAFPALSAFEKAVNMGGEAVIKEITNAKLLGFGGALDFCRAAAQAGGLAIVVLPAARNLKGDCVSNICAVFPAGTRVTYTAADTMYVVTDQGVAKIRHQSGRERLHAMVQLARPEHRSNIARAVKKQIPALAGEVDQYLEQPYTR